MDSSKHQVEAAPLRHAGNNQLIGDQQACLLSYGLSKDLVEQKTTVARQHCLKQLVKAILRESLYSTAINQPSHITIALWKQHSLLSIANVQRASLGLFRQMGDITLLKEGDSQPEVIEDPVALLHLLEREISQSPSNDAQQVTEELANSIENHALSLAFRERWRDRLMDQMKRSNSANFWSYLCKLPAQQGLVLLEQWGCVGHPFHPNHKSKMGLTLQQVLALSPDFEASFEVSFAALQLQQLTTECYDGNPGNDQSAARAWLKESFPDIFTQWQEELRACDLDPDQYLPIPVHPWQAQHILAKKFSDLILKKQLVLTGPSLTTAPAMSFRTMIPTGTTPHIKLPVAIQMTSAIRTVSPRSCEMGPRISRLINRVLESENHFGNSLYILPEQLGIHLNSDSEKGDLQAKHLSVLFRANPLSQLSDDEIAIPVASLLVDSPMSNVPLFMDIIRHNAQTADLPQATEFLRQYANTLLCGTLNLYFKYGIALEAHQQNSIAVFKRSGQLSHFQMRDFGGIRIHQRTLARSGHQLPLHRDRLTVIGEQGVVRQKIIHTVFVCHLGEMVMKLGKIFNLPDSHFWNVIKEPALQQVNAVKGVLDDEQWGKEYQAFFIKPWSIKALTRMRLDDAAGDIYVDMENPFNSIASL